MRGVYVFDRLILGDTDRAVELVGDITDEALLQTAAMSAFKANSEDLAAQTLHKALLSSNDQKFKLVALRFRMFLSFVDIFYLKHIPFRSSII